MRFRDIHIYSHQRSGSHYIAALLCKNFLGTDDYLPHYKNHFIGNGVYQAVWGNEDVAFVYCWRHWPEVLCSMWRFRERLGLQASHKDEFETTPANSMWKPGRCRATYVGTRDTRATTGISYYFRDVPISLKEHHKLHKNFWELLSARDNVKLVCYDDIMSEFHNTMLSIAKWLGSDRTEFENIDKKIGWSAE